jgi:hypothetical protein
MLGVSAVQADGAWEAARSTAISLGAIIDDRSGQ